MKFEPLYDYIVVTQWQMTEKVGSLYMPVDNEVVVKSTVAAVGSGHFLMSGDVKPLITKVGDVVMFNKNCAQFQIKEDGVEYYVMHEKDLLGIVRE